MSKRIAVFTTAVFIVSVAAFAQTETSSPSPAQTSRQSARTSSRAKGDTTTPMMLVGCLIKESDYRQAHGLGKGALNGAGLGDEFVLVDTANAPASAGSGAASTAPSNTSAASPSSTAATCSESGTGTAYRITGPLEDKMKAFAGHRIEVTGTFDHPRDARTAAGQTNAKLPAEIRVTAYHEAPPSVASAAPSTTAQGTSGSTPAPTTTAPAPANTAPEATAPQNPAPTTTARRMPKTASHQPLFALISLIAIGAGLGVRRLRRRIAS